jgi:hypothetical protein
MPVGGSVGRRREQRSSYLCGLAMMQIILMCRGVVGASEPVVRQMGGVDLML